MTEPPPSVEYAAQCTQWEMFDAYIDDLERKRELEAKSKKKEKKEGVKDKEEGAPEVKEEMKANIIHSSAMEHAAKILERMVNQNTYAEARVEKGGQGRRVRVWGTASERARGACV